MKYSEAKQYLKEGMTVRITKWTNGAGLHHAEGVEEPIIHLYEGGFETAKYGVWERDGDEFEILTNPDGSPWVNPNELYVLDEQFYDINTWVKNYYGIKQLSMSDWAYSVAPKKPTFMSSIVRKIKDLTLSADDRILRKHDFEDENGKVTESALTMMEDELAEERWNTRRTEVAEQLRKVEAEDKAA